MQTGFESLLARCQPGWALPGDFYHGDTVYLLDLDRVWRRGWLFAGHACEIPKPGDYFTLEVDTDSIIIVRADGGEIHGLHNVCRHRGSVICSERTGHAERNIWFSANRTSLVEGWVSESMDGRGVAPLMGNYQGPTSARCGSGR